jgi:hypothetical protein
MVNASDLFIPGHNSTTQGTYMAGYHQRIGITTLEATKNNTTMAI